MKTLILALLLCSFYASASENTEHMKEMAMEKRPTYLYKIVSMSNWERSDEAVFLPSADSEFIHFSTEDQLDRIIQKYWGDVPEYRVLKIETAKLPGELVFEANPGGTTKYYHLYNGSIPLNAVVESKVFRAP